MPKYIIPIGPKNDAMYNYTVLYHMALLKKHYIGTYYIPSQNIYAPVFKLDSRDNYPRKYFIEIDENIIEDSYKMICLQCGECCRVYSGAFMFSIEAMGLDEIIEKLPYRYYRLLDGINVKIYSLDVGRHGRCVFFDEEKKLCKIHMMKPVICMITFCGLVALRGNTIYYKYGIDKGKPVFKPWRHSIDLLKDMVKQEAKRMRRLFGYEWRKHCGMH
ncbi:YkgJ family cysteine cluster protein [Desulfurococcaceae archaeon MEX13E-LK6-19]|nr:YkgJ family cysteine cluster protein [Desulfurococcaceae archaeon MEX13E-LK6-19]